MKSPLIAILGPTASGKTSYAIALAHRINGAIVSADSRQVYAGMNIGTAKHPELFSQAVHTPDTPDIAEGIPHHLINIASPDRLFTLSDWLAAAEKALAAIQASGRTPILVGGTMLYIDALTDGYDIPDIPPNDKLRHNLEQQSIKELYSQLQQLDPAACTFIEPHNTRRIIRALEVMQMTGKKFSDLRTASTAPYDTTRIGLFSDWNTMKQNIERRSHEMLKSGLVEEAVALRTEFPNSPLLETINYQEALLIADGHLSSEEATQKMTQSTMRYAHRQMSWWKRRVDIGWVCI